MKIRQRDVRARGVVKKIILLVAATFLTAACTRLTPEQQIVADAAAALGGSERILAAGSLVLEGGGTQYNLGQDLSPEASGETFTVTNYRRAIDLVHDRARVELTRTPNFVFYQGPAPQTLAQGLDGSLGYNVNAGGIPTRIADSAAAERRDEWLQHPLLILRAALDPTTTLANARSQGGQSLVDGITADGRSFTLATDGATKLPASVSLLRDHPNLGDVVVSTAFADYENVDGLELPRSLTARVDGFVTESVSIDRQTVDGDAGDLTAPAAAASADPPAPRPQRVVATPLADGITHLTGGSHHSVLVEFEDHLMLIEAPLSAERTAAVIAKVRELVPGKPLTQLVNTHHHFDHSAGVRTAIAAGMTVITQQGNVAFFREMVARPHTLNPDALEISGGAANIEGVTGERTITDGTMTVELLPVANAHSGTMLIAWFPKQQLLVQADQYTPAAPIQMYAAAFLHELQQRKLGVDRIVPLHGEVVPYSQLLREVAEKMPPG